MTDRWLPLLAAYAVVVGATAYVGAIAQRVVNRTYHADLTWWLLLLSAVCFWVFFSQPFTHPTGGCYPPGVLQQKHIIDQLAILGWAAFMFLGLGAAIGKKDWFSSIALLLLPLGMAAFGFYFFVMAIGSTLPTCP